MLEAARAGATLRGGRGGRVGRRSRRTTSSPGVRELVDEVRLEVLFGDGTRLIVLLDPLGRRPAAADATGRARSSRRRRRADATRGCRTAGASAASSRSRTRPGGSSGSRPTIPFERVNARLGVRSRPRGRLPPRPPGRRLRALGAGRDADACALVGSAAASGRVDRRRRPMTVALRRASASPASARRPATAIRLGDTDLWIRVERGSPGARRRADLGLRQDDPAADDPGGRGDGRPSSMPSSSERVVVDPTARRRQGRHRDQGRPDRRRRASRQPGRSATGSSCRSARTPRRSWATA